MYPDRRITYTAQDAMTAIEEQVRSKHEAV